MRGVDFVVKEIVLGSISVFVLKDSLNDSSLVSVEVLMLVIVVAEISKQK